MRTTLGLLPPALLIGAASAAPASDGQLSRRVCELFHKSTTDKAQHGDFNTVQNMHQAIYNNRLPADENHPGSYTFTVRCGSANAPDACNGNIATTDAAMGRSNMVLCDAFFGTNTAQTTHNLNFRDQNGWCQQGQTFPFFFVAGQVLYHEMTHLDIIGAQAGLTERPADPNNPDDTVRSHGTVDVYDVGDDFDRQQYADEDRRPFPIYTASRFLKALWEDHDDGTSSYTPKAQRVENAESYAASALEWYFQVLCGFPDIDDGL